MNNLVLLFAILNAISCVLNVITGNHGIATLSAGASLFGFCVYSEGKRYGD